MTNKHNDIFYEIENIIHSMSQQCVTGLTLISEVLDYSNNETLEMIKSLESDLNDNQIIIDSLAFKILKNRKRKNTDFTYLWLYLGIADKLEDIGNQIVSVGYHMQLVFPYLQDVLEFRHIAAYNKFVIEILMDSVKMFVEIEESIDDVRALKKEELEYKKDSMLNTIISYMEDNVGLSSIYSEMLFIIKDLYRIALDSFSVVEKYRLIKEGEYDK